MAEPPVSLKNPLKAAFLAWLVPGLGHLYQGRRAKALLYAVCVLGLYVTGMILGEGKIVYWRWVNPLRDPENFRLYYIGQFFAGLAALPAVIQGTLAHFGLDSIFWGFMAEPPSDVINGLHSQGKLVEVGTIYTTVAGLINIFAIYDAFDGPAYADEQAPPAQAQAAVSAPETGASGNHAEGQA